MPRYAPDVAATIGKGLYVATWPMTGALPWMPLHADAGDQGIGLQRCASDKEGDKEVSLEAIEEHHVRAVRQSVRSGHYI